MLPPLTRPTMYFIGVTTAQSSMMRIFPRWMDVLGIDAQLLGYDAPPSAPAEQYTRIVDHIKQQPLALGALITTHKIDLLAAARDRFDWLDEVAEALGEISCISKSAKGLEGHAVDVRSSVRALEAFMPPHHWEQGGEVLCLGAGGAATAISVAMSEMTSAPRRFTVVDRNEVRLARLRDIHRRLPPPFEVIYRQSESAAENDVLMATLPEGSLIINATGMGKDRPGSPITDAAVFPKNGLAWELNYRGELTFLKQAQAQQAAHHLIVEDGWVYFLHGWAQVVAEVFHFTLTPDIFSRLAQTAKEQ